MIDVVRSTVFSTEKGFYMCADLDMAKNLLRHLLLTRAVEPKTIYIATSTSEEVLEKLIPLLSLNDSSKLQSLEPSIVGRIIYAIPYRRGGLFLRKRVPVESLLEVIDMVSELIL